MDLLVRLGILLTVGLLTMGLVRGGQAFVARQRRRALVAAPLVTSAMGRAPIHILVFSSADCRQCHTHQQPAIQRVLTLRAGAVSAEEIDAPSSPDLTERYHILTVPSTVVLDATGKAQAVNYGFAPTQQLLDQIDAARVVAA